MSLLSDDVYDGDWRVELGMYIASLHTDPSRERFDIINSICFKHLKRNNRRLCWKLNRYLAIAPPDNGRQKNYGGAKIIIAADEQALGGSGWKTHVYKWIGPFGRMEMRARWHKEIRVPENSILSTSYQYSNFTIYILPEDVWKVLFDMLPKNSDEFDEI